MFFLHQFCFSCTSFYKEQLSDARVCMCVYVRAYSVRVYYEQQVAAATGHNVTMVDETDEILSRSTAAIERSLGRIAKKKFADSEKVAN